MKYKFLFLILILSVSVFSAVTYDNCYKTALKYVKYSEGESLDMKPNALTHYGSNQYWVFEVKSMGNIQFMIPVDADTGFLFYESSAKDVMKAHYLSNFFATHDSFDDFLSDLLSFAQHQRSDLNNKKTNLETYVDPYLNVTISSEASYKSALDSAINNADDLRSAITTLQGDLISINSFEDISKIQSEFSKMFSEENAFLNSLNDVVDASNDLHVEVGQLFTDGEIDQSTRDSLLTYTTHSGLSDEVVSRQDALKSNKKVINDFFASMDSKIGQFYVKLVDRINSTSDSVVINEVLNTLANYSSTYSNFTKLIDEKQIPAYYEDVDDNMKQLYTLISKGNEDCSDKVLEDCQAVMSSFKDIDSLINKINASISSYSSSCNDGQRMACSIGDSTGYKTCVNGKWSSCEVSSSSSKYNYKLIGLLVLVIVGLIIFKYKDELMEKFTGDSEDEEEDTGSWQSQWN